jgi:ABC-type phosphate transport system ATPase subunit
MDQEQRITDKMKLKSVVTTIEQVLWDEVKLRNRFELSGGQATRLCARALTIKAFDIIDGCNIA